MRYPDLLLLAGDLRARAEGILVRAANLDDVEAQQIMRAVAAGYEKFARRLEQLAV